MAKSGTNGTPPRGGARKGAGRIADTAADKSAAGAVNGEVHGDGAGGALARLGTPRADAAALSVRERLDGKTILLTGVTGFVGKVLVAVAAKYLPNTRFELLVRGGAHRVESQVLSAPLFAGGLAAIARELVTPLEGDVGKRWFGLEPSAIPKADAVIHCAGLTAFNPPLDEALDSNSFGARHAREVAEHLGAAHVHISTCYVAGNRSGIIPENEDPIGWYPRRDELRMAFDPEREVEECRALMKRVHQEAHDQEATAELLERVRNRFRDEGRNPDDEEEVQAALKDARKKWAAKQLAEIGTRRAARWGWPNTYTYSKSLGEQLVLRDAPRRLSIVRPAIVESSIREPFAAWNEGINTSAPMIWLGYKGHRFYPTTDRNVIDMIPVDMICAGILIVTAATLEGEQRRIYQLGSSDSNPLKVARAIELLVLANRGKQFERRDAASWERFLLRQMETVPVSLDRYETFSAPAINRFAIAAGKALDGYRDEKLGTLRPLVSATRKGLKSVARATEAADRIVKVFKPFVHDLNYEFRCDNIRELRARMSADERRVFEWEPEQIDWRYYFMKVHVPGLHKWVFPEIDEKAKGGKKRVHTHKDLLSLFDAATANHADRRALERLGGGGIERVTYGELRERAERAAGALRDAGVKPGDRVVLCSEGRPEWPIAYFGALKAGAVAVPVDAGSSAAVVANLTRASNARVVVTSERVAERLGLGEQVEQAQRLTFDALGRGERFVGPRPKPDDTASLIYTSGTTGTPKGVLLTHANFAWMVASLTHIFDVRTNDVFLSVLPLHHTFEFSCGLLMPLSRGACITYLEEVSPERIGVALREQKVTCLIGVPLLWQALERRIRKEIEALGDPAQKVFKGLMSGHHSVRKATTINAGPLLFAPVHNGLGGRLRYLISGGAALPSDTLRFFHSLGFRLFEGYGLTETSPVLTVNVPGIEPQPGCVGAALRGVELKIHEPNADGVGEVWARGPNVMKGYDGDADATSAVLTEDRWFRTGDLGRLDKKGRLFLAGRMKDVIIDASGKNVYPDDVEADFGGCAYVKELAVLGIPDPRGGEKVACVVVPDYAAHDGLSRDEVQTRIKRHFNERGSQLPPPRRVKLLRFWDTELPRTATRKVKRNQVRDALVRLLSLEVATDAAPATAGGLPEGHPDAWLYAAAAALGAVEPATIQAATRFVEDLGFDSLMLVELANTVEKRTGIVLDPAEVDGLATVGALADRVREGAAPKAVETAVAVRGAHLSNAASSGKEVVEPREIHVPRPIANVVRTALGGVQRATYARAFSVKVRGRANIPWNRRVIAVSNHSSHLDMGLVKHALGDYAPNLSVLAARDYFFGSTASRLWFENFTNVIPIDRGGDVEASLRAASELIARGRTLLLFPEGTRSKDGQLQEFRRGLGYLVARHQIDVLPLWLGGTHRALPKGGSLPKARALEARIGPVLPWSWFAAETQALGRRDQYQWITDRARDAILALKERRVYDPTRPETLAPAAPADDARGNALDDVFAELRQRFLTQRVEAPVTFYFSLGDGSDGKWTVVVTPEKCEIRPGKPDGGNADCVLKTTPEMFRRIVRERYLPSVEEFVRGDVKTNDPALLGAFQSAFGL